MKKICKNFFQYWSLDLRRTTDLNISRFFYYFLFLNYIYSSMDSRVQRFHSYQIVSSDFWEPISLFLFFPKDFIFSFSQIQTLFILLSFCFFFCMIGFCTKFFSFLSACLGFFLLQYNFNQSVIHNLFMFPTVLLFILFLFPNMSSSYSLDSFFKSRKKRYRDCDMFWNQVTLRLISTLFLLFYFTSGFQKIRFSGLEWFTKAEPLSIGLVDMSQPYGELLLEFPLVIKILAFLVVVIQLSSLLPIIFPRLLPFYTVILFFGFHMGLDIFLGIHFSVFTYTFVFLIPWTKLTLFLSRGTINLETSNQGNLTLYLKKRFLKSPIGILKCIGIVFFVTLCICAPIFYKVDLYPFSKTAMYSKTESFEDGRIERLFLFKRNSKKESKLMVTKRDMYPIYRQKFLNNLLKLHRKNKDKEIKRRIVAFKKIVWRNDSAFFQNYTSISIEKCIWTNLSNFLERRGHNPDKCTVLLKYNIND